MESLSKIDFNKLKKNMTLKPNNLNNNLFMKQAPQFNLIKIILEVNLSIQKEDQVLHHIIIKIIKKLDMNYRKEMANLIK